MGIYRSLCCTFVQKCLATDDFVEELCNRLKLLIPHNFIAKAQSEFLSNKKENLRENEVLLVRKFYLCSTGCSTGIPL